MIRIALVEDDEDLRLNLVCILDRAEGMRCVGAYADAEIALANLPGQQPDVLLMDINLPGLSGIDCLHQLKRKLPKMQVIMLTVYEEDLTPREQEVLQFLAKGFLYKEIAERLRISYPTVHTHIRNIYEKLHVRSRSQAAAIFFKL